MMRNIVDELLALVVRELGLDPGQVGAGTPLFEGGLELDSFAVVDLVTRVETHFAIQLSDADFRPENFVDFKTLADVVQDYVDATARSTPSGV